MRHARTPEFLPGLLKNTHQIGREEVRITARQSFKCVESCRTIYVVSWIEVDEVSDTLTRHKRENVVSQIAMGINERQAVASSEVLNDQVGQHGGLTNAGAADDVEMEIPISVRDTNVSKDEMTGKVGDVLFPRGSHGLIISEMSRCFHSGHFSLDFLKDLIIVI